MANSTLRTDKIGAKNSNTSHDVGDFLVQENGVVKTTINNEDLTVQNSLKLEGVTLQEIYDQSNNLLNGEFDSRIKLITRSDTQAISNNFIVVVTKDEEIRARGQNSYFLTGASASNNEFITINNPHKISKIKEIVVANCSVYILYEDGELYVIGANPYGQLGIGNTADQYELVYSASNVKKISTSSAGHHADYNHTFILKTNNTLWATGNNGTGQLGLGDAIQRNAWARVPLLDEIGEIKDVFCCDTHIGSSYILTTDGKLLSCGYNGYGNLGFNDTIDRNTFQRIPALLNTKITKFACGAGYYSEVYTETCLTKTCLALSENGQLFSWGYNSNGELGTGDVVQKNVPVLVHVSLDVDEFIEELYAASGVHNSFVKTNKNRLFGTGYNGFGQLNQGNTVDSNIFIKVFDNVKSIHITSCLSYTYYIGLYVTTYDDKLYVFGYNEHGALGQNKTSNIISAEKVNFEHAAKIKQICSGGASASTVYILQEDGKVFASGYNGAGQIIMPVSTTVNRLTRIF